MVCVGTQECQHDGRHSEKEFWDQPRTRTKPVLAQTTFLVRHVARSTAKFPWSNTCVFLKFALAELVETVFVSVCLQDDKLSYFPTSNCVSFLVSRPNTTQRASPLSSIRPMTVVVVHVQKETNRTATKGKWLSVVWSETCFSVWQKLPAQASLLRVWTVNNWPWTSSP